GTKAPAELQAEVVEKVNELIARGRYGRLFAVVHFASHQWKVTSEDLILIENKLDVACGERIRLEKVLLVGADDFTLLGRPLLSGPETSETSEISARVLALPGRGG
ncbi:39S ribosomal protein L21, mitochondrial, partial [Eschrichtius robustus]|nr:39S ribosomal protein L21, mitochondrial [Eschrichtius robustus]